MKATDKIHEFYIKFLNDEGTLKNRTEFIIYMLKFVPHTLNRKAAVISAESSLIAAWKIGAHLSGSLILLGESSVIAVYSIGKISYSDKATFEVTSSTLCIPAIIAPVGAT